MFVGTPVIAKQPHNKIAKFVNTVEAKNIAFFITYENNMGFTIKEMKDSAEIRSIRVLGSIEVGNLKTNAINEMSESEKAAISKKAEKFSTSAHNGNLHYNNGFLPHAFDRIYGIAKVASVCQYRYLSGSSGFVSNI